MTMLHIDDNTARKLTEKFLDGTTTVAEEQLLCNYFAEADVAEELKPMATMFCDMATLPFKDKQPTKSRKTLWRRIAVAAAVAALIVGATTVAWHGYETRKLEARYGGSYMIVDGKRIDNLRQIHSHLQATLNKASSIEREMQPDEFVEHTETQLLNNIGDTELRHEIEQLLN